MQDKSFVLSLILRGKEKQSPLTNFSPLPFFSCLLSPHPQLLGLTVSLHPYYPLGWDIPQQRKPALHDFGKGDCVLEGNNWSDSISKGPFNYNEQRCYTNNGLFPFLCCPWKNIHDNFNLIWRDPFSKKLIIAHQDSISNQAFLYFKPRLLYFFHYSLFN